MPFINFRKCNRTLISKKTECLRLWRLKFLSRQWNDDNIIFMIAISFRCTFTFQLISELTSTPKTKTGLNYTLFNCMPRPLRQLQPQIKAYFMIIQYFLNFCWLCFPASSKSARTDPRATSNNFKYRNRQFFRENAMLQNFNFDYQIELDFDF